MARRLTLLALLACAMAAQLPPRKHSSESESFDPFADWSDYDESLEPPRHGVQPPYHQKPTGAKVILKNKNPKVNATVKNTKSENKKNIIKTTTINIESYTNFIVTKKPNTLKGHIKQPGVQNFVIELDDEGKRPVKVTSKRPGWSTSRRPPTSSRRPPATSRRPPTTSRKPPATSRRPPTRTTRKTTTRRPQKTTKTSWNKKTTCPPKKSGWLSSFFQTNKSKKVKKPSQAYWFSGFISRVSNWIWGSEGLLPANWFGSFFNENQPKTSKISTTTPLPLTTTTNNWFYSLIESEEDDNVYTVNDTKKIPKKSLRKNYKGYQLLRTYPDVQWKVHELLDLEEEADGSGLMWWTPPSINGSTDLLVPPDLLTDIKDHLKSLKIDFDVIIWDLQKAIMYENPRLSKKQRLELEYVRGHPMTWKRYHRYADMLRYLEYLQHSYSDVIELKPLGRSSEGLPLVAVKISIPSNNSLSDELETKEKKKKWRLRSRMKPAVFIEGGSHGREWIAPAVATWILKTLVEGEKGIGVEHEVLEQADFYIMPVVNPDGYEHSHTHDRLWRKTRSRHSDHADDYYVGWLPWFWGRTECVGVDADRNWDYHWGETGASRDPCSELFAGPHPFSEPETRAVSAFLAEHRDQMKVYISLHAYSQAWLVPSSHAQHAPFSDDGVLMEMGKLATAALADLYGTKYQVGTAAELRQPASGMSHDWAKARAGVKYAYHVNLRDSFGPYGFLLPGSQIEPTAKETWQAIKAIVDNLSPT